MKIVKRRLMWIIELFVWFLVLLLLSCGIMYAKYNYKKSFDTYQIFLPDVDGLIVGSPVKFMGIQVGYVNQLNITGEDIYVNFIITNNDIQIPRGSKATVEFSGLGGSKSLELYPPSPRDTESSMFIIPQPPKRIGDSLGLLSDMFDKAMEIAYDFSHFMEEMSDFNKKSKNRLIQKHNVKPSTKKTHAHRHKIIEQSPFDEFMVKCNCWLDRAKTQGSKFHDNMQKKKVGKNEQN